MLPRAGFISICNIVSFRTEIELNHIVAIAINAYIHSVLVALIALWLVMLELALWNFEVIGCSIVAIVFQIKCVFASRQVGDEIGVTQLVVGYILWEINVLGVRFVIRKVGYDKISLVIKSFHGQGQWGRNISKAYCQASGIAMYSQLFVYSRRHPIAYILKLRLDRFNHNFLFYFQIRAPRGIYEFIRTRFSHFYCLRPSCIKLVDGHRHILLDWCGRISAILIFFKQFCIAVCFVHEVIGVQIIILPCSSLKIILNGELSVLVRTVSRVQTSL